MLINITHLITKLKIKKIIFLLAFFVLVVLTYIYIIQKPSNTRDWELGFEVLPKISIDGPIISVKNIRDYNYLENKAFTKSYQNQTYNIEEIEKVWFLFEPFVVKPFAGFGGVAHTYFVFDFKNKAPVAVSVEARREKNEKYDAFSGIFNQYELIYIWGTEQDETVKRVISEDNKLFMYPLKISNQGARSLFVELAKKTKLLEENPQFYNTFVSNCTNELAKNADKVKKGAIPFNIALFLPGYSVEELYRLGYLPNDVPLDKLKEKYYISNIIKEIYKEKDFSKKLREKLEN